MESWTSGIRTAVMAAGVLAGGCGSGIWYRVGEGQMNEITPQAIAGRAVFIPAASGRIVAQLPALVQAARKSGERHTCRLIAAEEGDHDRALAVLRQLIDPAAAGQHGIIGMR